MADRSDVDSSDMTETKGMAKIGISGRISVPQVQKWMAARKAAFARETTFWRSIASKTTWSS